MRVALGVVRQLTTGFRAPEDYLGIACIFRMTIVELSPYVDIYASRAAAIYDLKHPQPHSWYVPARRRVDNDPTFYPYLGLMLHTNVDPFWESEESPWKWITTEPRVDILSQWVVAAHEPSGDLLVAEIMRHAAERYNSRPTHTESSWCTWQLYISHHWPQVESACRVIPEEKKFPSTPMSAGGSY